MIGISSAPIYKLEALNNIFIEMTAKNCNRRCKSCYIKFQNSKPVKDFISYEKIKELLDDTKNRELHCIYLTGAEPMTHPDFNLILRTCLKRCNVCICTNGSFLNEKKIRFLKKVEDEGVNQIFFRLSLTHFDERESDNAKYRGHYRQTLFALKTLSSYNFTSVLSIQNFYNLDKNLIENEFKRIFREQNITTAELQVICSYPLQNNDIEKASCKTDCMFGRSVTQEGVFACPFLSGDYRGRVGSSFRNFSGEFRAETDFCLTCSRNNNCMFTIG